jgi:hypothetical protein
MHLKFYSKNKKNDEKFNIKNNNNKNNKNLTFMS